MQGITSHSAKGIAGFAEIQFKKQTRTPTPIDRKLAPNFAPFLSALLAYRESCHWATLRGGGSEFWSSFQEEALNRLDFCPPESEPF